MWCDRTSRKGGTPITRNEGWGTEEVANEVGEKREARKMIEGIRDRGEQPPTGLEAPVWPEEDGSRVVVDRARMSMEK